MRGLRAGAAGLLLMTAGGAARAQERTGWQAPAYADTSAFVERELTVGSAPFELPATLTLPRAAAAGARVPVVVLVHGSGPNDRDGTVGVKKPLKDLAWGLASRGVAVLRFEKRTRLHAQQMDLSRVTIEEETVADALSALAVARSQPEVDPARVFLLGHSLGGMIAPEIAVRDGAVAGVVLLAAGARPLAASLLAQLDYVARMPENQSPQAVQQIAHMRALAVRIVAHEAAPEETGLGAPVSYFYDLDERAAPSKALAVRAPMLILQGERDYQVTMDDFAVWQATLAGRRDVAFRSYPGLDHLFVAGDAESTPRETMLAPGNVSGDVIEDLVKFVASVGAPRQD